MFVGRRVYTCNTSLKPGSTKSILRITLLLRIPIPHRQIHPRVPQPPAGGFNGQNTGLRGALHFQNRTTHAPLHPFDCPASLSLPLHTLRHPVSFCFTIQSFSEQLDSIACGKKSAESSRCFISAACNF